MSLLDELGDVDIIGELGDARVVEDARGDAVVVELDAAGEGTLKLYEVQGQVTQDYPDNCFAEVQCTGFSNAASVMVGKCVGAGELNDAYKQAKRLVYLCSGFILAVACTLFFLRGPILTRMGLSGDSFEAGTRLLLIYLPVCVVRMGNWMQNDICRSSGDSLTGTVLEIVFMYALLLPCVLLSGFVWKLAYWLVFLFCYIDEPVRYVLMQIHLYSGRWIRPVTEQGIAALPVFLKKHRRSFYGK